MNADASTERAGRSHSQRYDRLVATILAAHDERCAPGDHPAIVEKIVPDNRELRLVLAVCMGIGNFAGLDESVQFLAIFSWHMYVSVLACQKKSK